MTAPIDFPEYGAMSGLALFGSIARGRQWIDANGKLIWSKVASEVATAVCLAVGAVWAGGYWHVELPAVAVISVLSGWLGPTAVAAFVFKKFGIVPPGEKE